MSGMDEPKLACAYKYIYKYPATQVYQAII